MHRIGHIKLISPPFVKNKKLSLSTATKGNKQILFNLIHQICYHRTLVQMLTYYLKIVQASEFVNTINKLSQDARSPYRQCGFLASLSSTPIGRPENQSKQIAKKSYLIEMALELLWIASPPLYWRILFSSVPSGQLYD